MWSTWKGTSAKASGKRQYSQRFFAGRERLVEPLAPLRRSDWRGGFAEREASFGFEEFQRSAHDEVVIQHLLFVCTQRAGVGFAREFSRTLGVDIRQTQSQQLTRGRGRQVTDFGPDGSTPDFGFGCSSRRFHTPCS